jgi:hypothetical protein
LSEATHCQVDFEVVVKPEEGTNIDVLVTDDTTDRTIIEIKLTESAFGRARADARRLAKLENVYRPLLLDRVEESCLRPTVFFRDYQLFRNVAQIRRESHDRVLFLLPRARRQLWEHATVWCGAPVLRLLTNQLTVVALEDVVSALSDDITHFEAEQAWVSEIAEKYLPSTNS